MTPDHIEITMRSREYYRVNQRGENFVYNPLRDSPDIEGSKAMHVQGIPPATLSSKLRRGKTYPTLPPPPPVEDMGKNMKKTTFKGVRDEDMDRFWFVADAVWTMQNVNTDDVKRVQLAMAFNCCALGWFMGYLAQNADPSVAQIKDALKQQFWKPKSYSQCKIELKYIKQGPKELVWEADQWLKQTINDEGFVNDDK